MSHFFKHFRVARVTFLTAIVALCACVWVQSATAQTIREIQVEGAQRIEAQTVVSYLDFNLGDSVNQDQMNEALKTLYATGLFADVSLVRRGTALVVQVVENPVINEIVFEGNKRIEDGQLQSEIQLRPRQVFTRTRIQSDVSRIYQVYRRSGRFSAIVEPKIISLDQNRVNIVFEIEEGPVTKVESVRFIGNKQYSDAKLRDEISTKESVWYSFISTSDRYDPDRLAFDQELLRRFYLSQGYADFRVTSATAELSQKRDVFYITINLEEGSRYKVASTTINSALRDFDTAELEPFVGIEAGDWYNANRVQSDVEALVNALGDRQYAFADVRPDVQRNRDESTINLVYNINEAPPVFVERINVNGNSRTLDKVVRREIEVVEGDPFNRTKIAASERNIRNLDYFETASLDISQGSAPDKTVIDVNLSEKSTGEISVGAGFSTQDGPLADIRLSERNFLGKGQRLLLSATVAGERSEFNFSFTEPFFLNRDVSAGFDVFNITRDLQDESSFDQRRTGAGVRVGYPLSERWRQNLRYRFERNDITNIEDDASLFIQLQEGQRDTSAISQRLTYDNRDSIVSPTNGWMLWLDTEFAGLGGDAQYVSGRTGASFYYPLGPQWTLNVLAEGGSIQAIGDENIQINERFFIGGTNLRGFERAGIGPRDLGTDDALGGNTFYRGSIETTFPLGLGDELGILGHVFSDAGTLFDLDDEVAGANFVDESSLRLSVGAGISWRSPFGPIRIDFAAPILDEDFDEDEVFQFNFGTRF